MKRMLKTLLVLVIFATALPIAVHAMQTNDEVTPEAGPSTQKGATLFLPMVGSGPYQKQAITDSYVVLQDADSAIKWLEQQGATNIDRAALERQFQGRASDGANSPQSADTVNAVINRSLMCPEGMGAYVLFNTAFGNSWAMFGYSEGGGSKLSPIQYAYCNYFTCMHGHSRAGRSGQAIRNHGVGADIWASYVAGGCG